MAGLVDIVREEVRKYDCGGRGWNSRLFFLADEPNQVYTVVAIDYPQRRNIGGLVMLARIVEDKVVIEEDNTDKPLLDALIQQGIPREQIVLAYQGETIPEPTTRAGMIDRLRSEVRRYELEADDADSRLIALMNDARAVYGLVDLASPEPVALVLLTQVTQQHILIEADRTGRPLVEALVRRGIPREQIVLVYQGEVIPDPVGAL